MPHLPKASTPSTEASSSLAARLLADAVLAPVVVTAIAIAVLHLSQPDAVLHDPYQRYDAGFAIEDQHIRSPALAGLGAANSHAPATAPEALTSIR